MKLPLLGLAALVATSLFAGGCSLTSRQTTLSDSFHFDLFAFQNDLSSPYVAGSSFSLNVACGSCSNTQGWTVKSSDSGVLSLGAPNAAPQAQTSFTVPATAGAPGVALISVFDAGGKQVDQAPVRVAIPTRAAVYAYGRVLAGESDAQAAVTQFEMIEGGTATFLVRYFDDSGELTGAGGPGLTTDGVVGAQVHSSGLAPDRDWLSVTAQGTGTGDVNLVVAGTEVTKIPVTVVDASTVAGVLLDKQRDDNAHDGDSLYVVGRAVDASGADVFGASFTWSVDGQVLPPLQGEPSDLATYTFTKSASDALTAGFGGHYTSVGIHARPRAGGAPVTLGSTANTGCSAARSVGRDAPLAPGAALVALIAALGTRARRRRRNRPLLAG
ncbi:MAG TPA: hypothetical protein VGI39_08510 [Polyangiaceae bacterium]|jgi:hypothetical protein